jgi:hypothetical protein
MGRSLWKALGSVNLTIWLLLGIALDLTVGSCYAGTMRLVYSRLNDLRFQEWLQGNGFRTSWWVWLLFALLLLFGLNTAACTADRLLYLMKRRREHRPGAFAVIAAPSVMHLCFLVIIGSHAVSQFGAEIRQIRAATGSVAVLPGSSVTVNGVKCDVNTAPGLNGHVKACNATLTLERGASVSRQEVGVLEPVLWNGYSIHLVTAGKSGPGVVPPLDLIVKRDPGLLPIIAGNGVLCLLMLWYFPMVLKKKPEGGGECL